MQKSDTKIMRVAAYCRVSTDRDDQANSLTSQQKYFREYIDRNPLWELTEVYVDTGITGTSTQKRASFNQMIADAERKEFDLILTKEISRFARNTLDSIFYTRKLKGLNIGVIFMNDNINTLDPDAELRLTIMSSIAQEESRKTSERVKWGQKRRMEQGVVFGRSMLGYDVKDGKMNINVEGAKVVRVIFHKFVNENKGTHIIARELREAGIKTFNYMKEWSNTVILRILRNEKYAGDLIQKKTYTPNYLNHDKKYNKGEEEFVVLQNHHEPIIDRELFDKAQAELERRRPDDKKRAKHSNRYCFSGKLKCGYCGCSFVSRTKKRKDGSSYKAWRCLEAANHGKLHLDKEGNKVGCDGRQINNDVLMQVMSQVVKGLFVDKERLVKQVENIVMAVLDLEKQGNSLEKLRYKIKQLTTKRQKLIKLYLSGDLRKADFQGINTKLEKEIAFLEQEQISIVKQEELQEDKKDSNNNINKTIEGIVNGDIQDETFYRNILSKIVIYDRYRMDVYLNRMPFKLKFYIADLARIKKNLAEAQSRCNSDASLGTEEIGHFEMVATIVHQLTRNMTIEQIKAAGMESYFVDHTAGIYPIAASGVPFNAMAFASKGDAITDLVEDMAAEQKARTTYDNILRMVDDPDVIEPIRFLREREVVHFQRFGEALRVVQDNLDSRNFYAINPEFDSWAMAKGKNSKKKTD